MALTRQFLKGMGLTPEQEDAIIEAHADTVGGLKEKIKNAEAERDEALNEAQKPKDDGFKAKYEELEKQFNDYKADVDAKATRGKLEKAYKDVLKDAGISDKRADAILKITDFKALKLDKDGVLENLDQIKTNVASEFSEFIPAKETVGASVPTPQTSNVTTSTKTKAEIMAIRDSAERRAEIKAHPELFIK